MAKNIEWHATCWWPSTDGPQSHASPRTEIMKPTQQRRESTEYETPSHANDRRSIEWGATTLQCWCARFSGASLALASLLASGVAGCSKAQATLEPEVRSAFPLGSPVVTDTFYEREHVAEIRASRRVEVRSRISGFLESVAVDEGQPVEAGQLMFSVNATELKQQALIARAATSSAQAELKTAELEREGTQLLFDKKVVSAAELALADSKVQSLQAKLEEARANEGQAAINLRYTQIRAPFGGVVNRIPFRLGSAVDESEPLTTITDTSEVYAYFRVSEAEYLEYTAAASGEAQKAVTLRLADGSTYPSPGVVDAVESEFDRETGNIAFRARFPNESGRLKHGSAGKIVLKTDLVGALTVPQRSTFEIQEQLYVYVVDAENTARARRIVPKLRLDDTFVVSSGLDKTDLIILEGVQKVRDGAKVEALPTGEAHGS